MTDDFKMGVSMGSYFGLGVDYGDSWAGRYYETGSPFEYEYVRYIYLKWRQIEIER